MQEQLALDYDFVIIGSGFGGSVAALRLAEKGYSVCVIEQGQRFSPSDYARSNWDVKRYLWAPKIGCRGIQNLTLFRHALVLSGAGVGGGSLVYANTLAKPSDAFFNATQWKHLADWKTELEPCYETVAKMLGRTTNPVLADADLLLKECARELKRDDTFAPTDVAVYFGPPKVSVPDPYFNGRGPRRSGCSFCGGCMVGCRHNAKNSLDMNYLFLAEKLGVELVSDTKVTVIETRGNSDGSDGYRLVLETVSSLVSSRPVRSISARRVIVAGGVLGTVDLLLRCRDIHKTLPNLSPCLGQQIRTNSEVFTGVTEFSIPKERNHSNGVAIGSIFHPDDTTSIEPVRYPKGSNFMRLVSGPLIEDKNEFHRMLRFCLFLCMHPLLFLRMFFNSRFAENSIIFLVMQNADNFLEFRLKRSASSLFRKTLVSRRSQAQEKIPSEIPVANLVTRLFAKKVNGTAMCAVSQISINIPTTAHILGGCPIGENAQSGVINSNHEVFGYKGLYVCDGSVIPTNLGVNPSYTIAALAERAMTKIPLKSEKTANRPEETVAQVVANSKRFFASGRTRSLAFRLKQLEMLERMLIDNRVRILQAMHDDLKKGECESYFSEFAVTLDEIKFARKKLKTLMKPKRVSTPLTLFPSRGEILAEPYGVALVIAPWNYPLQLTLSPVVGSIAAGNCTILKPSEISGATSSVLKQLLERTFSPEYLSVIEGDASVSQTLLAQRFDIIFFTGSPQVGRLVMEAAAKQLTPVVLELGGKSPCIVDRDIDIQATARRVAWGKFTNAGQTCVAPDYLLVHKEVKETLILEVKRAIEQFYGADPRYSEDYGRVISNRHTTRLSEYLKQGRILIGGKVIKEENYIEPTLIDQVTWESPIMKDEIFGPILPVLEFSTLEDAIAQIRANEKPLSLYVFSKNKAFVDQVLSQTTAGGVCVNDTLIHLGAVELPFGGVGYSGIGRYHGIESFRAFSNFKSVLRKPFFLDLFVRYPPYERMTRIFRKIAGL